MALKYRITKSAYAKLSEELQAEYRGEKDDAEDDKQTHFVLEVTGIEGSDELRRAKDREKARADEAEEKITELEEQVSTLEAGQTKEGRDAKKIDANWKKKYEKDIAEKDDTIKQRDAYIVKQLKSNTALKLATEISTAPSLLVPVIEGRIEVDFSGDEPALHYLGKDGKRDKDMTPEKLSAELVANPEYKSIVIGSKATGSGAHKGGLPSGNRVPASSGSEKIDVNALDGADFVSRIKAKAQAKAAA